VCGVCVKPSRQEMCAGSAKAYAVDREKTLSSEMTSEMAKLHGRWLATLLVVYALIQMIYLSATPLQDITLPENLPQSTASQPVRVGIGPDEKEHYLYIRSLAERGQLPAQSPQYRKDPEQYVSYEMQHPPLFYAVTAILYKMTTFLGPDGQWFFLRAWCSLLGAFVILFAGKAALAAFPDRPLVAFGVPALVAFLPIHGHMNSVLSNEPMGLALGTWAWLQAVRIARSEKPPTVRAAALLGLTLGVGMLVRVTVLLWLPALLLLLIAACRQKDGKLVPVVGSFLGAFLLLSLPWFGYLQTTFGTPLFRSHHLPLVDRVGPGELQSVLGYVALWVGSTSWAPFWLTQFYIPGLKTWQALLLLTPFMTVVLLFFHYSNQTKLPEAEREKDTAGRAILWAAFLAVGFCIVAVFYQILNVDWSIMNYAGRYILSSVPASALLFLFSLTTIRRSAQGSGVAKPRLVAPLVLAVLLVAFDVYSALLVKQFYRDHPTQDAVQPITKT
jgi:hypothetical protein